MLKYNISSNKEPDNSRVTKIVAAEIVLILIFLSLGFLIQSRDRAEIVKNNEKLDALAMKIENTTEKVGGYKKVIKENQKRFGKEVDYINRIIERSTIPFTDMFDEIENLLPQGVAVRSLLFTIDKGKVMYVQLESESMAPIIKVMEKLPNQKLVITEPNSKREERYYTATIVIGGKK